MKKTKKHKHASQPSTSSVEAHEPQKEDAEDIGQDLVQESPGSVEPDAGSDALQEPELSSIEGVEGLASFNDCGHKLQPDEGAEGDLAVTVDALALGNAPDLGDEEPSSCEDIAVVPEAEALAATGDCDGSGALVEVPDPEPVELETETPAEGPDELAPFESAQADDDLPEPGDEQSSHIQEQDGCEAASADDGQMEEPSPEQAHPGAAGEEQPSSVTSLARIEDGPVPLDDLAPLDEHSGPTGIEWVLPGTLMPHPQAHLLPAASAEQDEQLRDSLSAQGVQRPCFVTDVDCAEGANYIIDGHRRVRLSPPDRPIPIIRRSCADLSVAAMVMLELNLLDQTGRKLSVRQIAEMQHELVVQYAARGKGRRTDLVDDIDRGTTVELVAKDLGVSVNSVSENRKLLESPLTPDAVWAAIDAGRITRTRAVRAVRLLHQRPDVVEALAKAANKKLPVEKLVELPAVKQARADFEMQARASRVNEPQKAGTTPKPKSDPLPPEVVEVDFAHKGKRLIASLKLKGTWISIQVDPTTLRGVVTYGVAAPRPEAVTESETTSVKKPNKSPVPSAGRPKVTSTNSGGPKPRAGKSAHPKPGPAKAGTNKTKKGSRHAA